MNRFGILIGIVLLSCVASNVYAAGPENWLTEYQQAIDSQEPMRNVVHLYLRLAGIIWIVAEWAAAFVLFRAFYLLRARLEDVP